MSGLEIITAVVVIALACGFAFYDLYRILENANQIDKSECK